MSEDQDNNAGLVCSHELSPAEPLWQRVPTHNAQGKMLSDFMMVIPGFKHMPEEMAKKIVQDIRLVLSVYEKFVVFAELNAKLNVLWVSVEPVAGICLELAAAIHHKVPQAKVVAQRVPT